MHLPNMGVRPMMHPDVSPLFLINQQMRFGVLPRNIIGMPPMPLSPQFLARHPNPNMMGELSILLSKHNIPSAAFSAY